MSESRDNLDLSEQQRSARYEVDDSHKEARKSLELAHLYMTTRSYTEALECYQQALDGADRLKVSELAEIRRGMADCYLRQERHDKALKEIQKAEELLSFVGNESIELGKVYSLAAEIKADLGTYDEAMSRCQQAFEILRETGENREVGKIQRLFAVIYAEKGELEKARSYYEDSISTFRRIGDEEEVLISINDLARVCFITSRWSEAIEHLERGLKICKKAGKHPLLAMFVGNLGMIYRKIGDWKRAEEYLKSSLELYEKLGRNLEIARSYISLGRLLLIYRRWNEAQNLLEKARNLCEKNCYAREESLSYESLGELAFETKDYSTAEEHYTKARKIANKIAPEGDLINSVYWHLGELKVAENELNEAIRACRRSLEVSRRLSDVFNEGIAYRVLGLAYAQKGNETKANNYFSKSLQCLQATGEKFEQGRTLFEMGRLHVVQDLTEDERKEHLLCLRRAERMFQELEAHHWLATSLLEIARVKVVGSLPDRALEPLGQAGDAFNRLDDRDGQREVEELRRRLEERLIASSLSNDNNYNFFEDRTHIPDSSQPLSCRLDNLLKVIIDKVNANRGLVAAKYDNVRQFKVESHLNFKDSSKANQLLRRLLDLKADEFEPGKPFILTELSGRFSVIDEAEEIGSLMVIPFGLRGSMDGLLYVDRAHQDNSIPFGQKELNFFTAFSHQVDRTVVEMQREELIRQREELYSDNIYLRQQLEEGSFKKIITRNREMLGILRKVKKIANSSFPVLLEGETGTGKELIARAIHYSGKRRDKRFVAVNCAALQDTLLESELFGHKKGAFTGAIADKKGLFEEADGGTIFLDEIINTSESLQAKLLRALEEGEIRRVGDTQPRKVNVRVISATNNDIEREVIESHFRKDLYYRLNTFHILIPPLRHRKEDIPFLIDFFIGRYSQEEEKKIDGITPEAKRMLMNYDWPGNVRELENEIKMAVTLTDPESPISQELFSGGLDQGNRLQMAVEGRSLTEKVASLERREIAEALRESNWITLKAAELLGLHEATLRGKMRKYGIFRLTPRRKKQ